MSPLAKTILLICAPAVAGAVLLDCGVKWTGWTALMIGVIALCFSPILMMIFESREATERLRQLGHGNSVGET